MEWVIDMSTVLYAKNNIAFVDGSLPVPVSDSTNLSHWRLLKVMVKKVVFRHQ